ncbi:MAG: hypothetical protein COV45_01975 [Deltaproteobacteria bacterium CG11_big_fil_rev_8_21_14_0_20_47_16]|nr:MAG: hypothetical protein COV45_01975 [Deltaproteobacteria bacterium CG11_big_fil_rev_8_21_14_0_20_47_16]
MIFSKKRDSGRKKKKGLIRRTFAIFWGSLKLSVRFAKYLLPVLLIMALVGTWYYFHLAKWAEQQFSKTQKWNLPSRIYSDAEYIYPGLNLPSRKLTAKLGRLGYRHVANEVKGPGEYAAFPDHLDIWLHDFSYPLESFVGFPARISINATSVTRIVNIDSQKDLATIRLEPELVASVFDSNQEDRTIVSLNDVPQVLLESIIQVEDERFFRHHGVDPIGISRAMVKNLMSFRFAQGGSTLTQQLVKNYFLHSRKSLWRKFKEAIIAISLERHHSKGEILEAYINEIYFGQRGASSVSGVGEAARLYFGKDVKQLNIGECALLAGMIRSPYEYSPFHNKEAAKSRRDFVLNRLYERGIITAQQLAEGKAEPIITPERRVRVVMAPYFIQFVKQQLQELYPEDILQSEGLRIFTTLDMTAQLVAENVVQSGLVSLEKSAASILPKNHADPLQGALISIQPQTGYIRSMVGGRDFANTQFNRITQAKRQPGSTFKPFVYLTAFDPHRSQKTTWPSAYIDDSKFSIESGGQQWSPNNYDKKEHGRVTLRTALEHSYNIATAKLALNTGLDEIVAAARDAGFTSDLQPVPSIALGSFEVTPLELASAYTIFANNGIRAQPLSIIQVVDKNNQPLQRKVIEVHRKFDAGPVYLTTNVLKGVMDRGTGASARRMGFTGIAAGKTGTTSNYKDAWFVGFTPSLMTLVWVGYDDNATMNLSGGRAALPIWTDYMKQLVGNSEEDFSPPPSVVLVKIDPTSGLLSNKHCPDGVFEPFIDGFEPDKACE